ncbi:hypothetical protein OH76DRAFT_1487090 [Lentinus brumalis]|uniref:Uncharacterized protein n=1 Tax=Lentinus brumalis TaxID=2498619 RepID=A0A371CW64_9APHY|nr:hypothetical protein OH76DRAFT_1487090 [Polyporus brumalis]
MALPGSFLADLHGIPTQSQSNPDPAGYNFDLVSMNPNMSDVQFDPTQVAMFNDFSLGSCGGGPPGGFGSESGGSAQLLVDMSRGERAAFSGGPDRNAGVGGAPFGLSSGTVQSRPYSFTEAQLQCIISESITASTRRLEQQVYHCNAQLDELRTKLAEERAAREEAEAAATAAQQRNMRNERLSPHILGTIHKTSTDLLGCFEKVRKTTDPTETPYWDLPNPLSPGAPKRLAGDGESVLYNPNWLDDVTSTANAEYIMAVVNHIFQNHASALDPEKHTHSVIKKGAQTYFRSLRDEWRNRRNEEGLVRHKKGNGQDREYNHKRYKTTERRRVLVPFRKLIGYSNTVGIEHLVNTDYASSEHSDYGPDGHDRKRLGVHEIAWMSEQHQKVKAGLDTLRCAVPRTTNENVGLPLLTPKDDGVDYTTEEQLQFLRFVAMNAADRKKRGSRGYVRFKAAKDKRIRPGVIKKGILYKEGIREESRNEEEFAHLDVPSAPTNFTVFSASIPQELLSHPV